MKKSLILTAVYCFVLLIASLFFCGCILNYSNDSVICVTQACYAIPGCYTCDQHASRITLIEQDKYDRRLFAIRVTNGYGVNAILIAQKSDDRFVYYYDNISYICTKNFNEYSSDELTRLKAINDWNKPLNENKMIQRERNARNNLIPQMNLENLRHFGYTGEFTYCDEVFEKHVAIPADYRYSDIICDRSTTGQELYLMDVYRITQEENQIIRENDKYYLMVINEDGTYDPENFILGFDDLLKSNEPLAEIKERNNWEG